MKAKLFVLVALIHCTTLFSATITATGGNWSDPASWSPAVVPTCGDSIVIPKGVIIHVDAQINLSGGACAATCPATVINLLGTLIFDGGQKLTLCDNSAVYFGAFGTMVPSGGGNSNLLTIGTTAVWQASDGVATSLTNPTPMPVELTTFYALHKGNNILLHWETATETNNRAFDIEKSEDGKTFKKMGEQISKATNGNSLVKLNYDFTDAAVSGGTVYYRLKQNDYNGNFKYSSIATVDVQKNKNIMFTVYPNPNQGQFTVDFSGIENNHEINIVMFDQEGKIVYENTIASRSIVTNTFDVTPTTRIANGMYMVNFIVEGIKYPVKVLVQ